MLYKAVRVLDDGRKVSAYIDDLEQNAHYTHPGHKMLEYSQFKETVSPKGSQGIFVYTNLDDSYETGNVCPSRTRFKGLVEIYEVDTIDKEYKNREGFYSVNSMKLGTLVGSFNVFEDTEK